MSSRTMIEEIFAAVVLGLEGISSGTMIEEIFADVILGFEISRRT